MIASKIPYNPWQMPGHTLRHLLFPHFVPLVNTMTESLRVSSETPLPHILLSGPRASGRSHIAAAVMHAVTEETSPAAVLILTGRTGPYPSAEALLDQYKALRKQCDTEQLAPPPGLLVIDSLETIQNGDPAESISQLLAGLEHCQARLLLIVEDRTLPSLPPETMNKFNVRTFQVPSTPTHQIDPWEPTGQTMPSPGICALSEICGNRLDFWAILRPIADLDDASAFADRFLDLFEECIAPRIGRFLDGLAPQQRYIAASLAALPGTISVRDLADKTGTTSQTASRQLFELQRAGIVTKTAVGRESWYEISLPIYRYYFLLDGCGNDKVREILHLVYDWHVPPATRQLMASSPETAAPYYSAALESLDSMLGKNPKNERALWFRTAALTELNRPLDALASLKSFLEATQNNGMLRKSAAADLFPLFFKHPDHLKEFVVLWKESPQSLRYAIAQWIRSISTKESQNGFSTSVASRLTAIMHAEMGGCDTTARFMNASIAKWKDKQVLLLALPKELRKLISIPKAEC